MDRPGAIKGKCAKCDNKHTAKSIFCRKHNKEVKEEMSVLLGGK